MKNFYYCEFVFVFFFAFMYLYILPAVLNMDIVIVINDMVCLILHEGGSFKPKLSAYHEITQGKFINCKCL
jgi:hypothetical protein